MAAVTYSIAVGDESWSGSVSYTERTRQEIAIATASTDTAVNFGGVTTADVVVIYSDQAITVNYQLNTGTDITIDANRPHVLMGTAMTALFVSNASGSTANIVIDLYGA